MAKKRKSETIRLPKGIAPVEVRAETFDEESRTVDIVWSTGAAVKRRNWRDGEFMEELSMDPKHVRLERLNDGAPVLNSHWRFELQDVIGTVVKSTARIEKGQGVAKIQLSGRDEVAGIVQDLRDGIITKISVGYRIHKAERTEGDENSIAVVRAVDWEPMEVSLVAIPADPGAGVRSEVRDETYECEITRYEDEDNAAAASTTQENMMNKREAAKSLKDKELDAFAIGLGVARKDKEDDAAFRKRILAKIDEQEAEDQRAEQEVERRRQAETTNSASANARGSQPEARSEPSGGGQAPSAGQGQGDGERQVDADAGRREATDGERKRISDLTSIATRHSVSSEVLNQHMRDGTSVEKFRQIVLDAMADESQRAEIFAHAEPKNSRQDADETRRTAISNALMHRYDSTRFKLEDSAREWRNMSMLEVQKELMRERGERTRGMSDTEIAARAFHSTADFPIILGNVARMTLLDGYNAYANTFQNVGKRNVVTDFKEIRRSRLGENPELVKVNEHGEFPRGTMVEGTESYKIATYGRIIGMTRQMLINDELNAFADVPRRWGRQVAKLEGDIVWGLIVNNAKMSSDNKALFHADHGNLAASGTILGIAGLKEGRKTFRKQKDIDGNRIDLAPKFLFVPTDLEVDAQQLLQSTTTPAKTDDVVPEAIRSLTPVAEHRLDDISATVWFLFADPNDVDGGLEYAYLAGNEAPYTEERMGFDTDGVEYKVRHDFGAGLTDWRFGYKNPGASS